MNCQQTQAELSAYIDGELSPAIRAEVETHVRGCVSCRNRLEELGRLTEGVAALPKAPPAPQFLAAVRRKIAMGREPEPAGWADWLFRPVWLKAPMAAAALVLLLMGAVALLRPPKQTFVLRQTLAMKREESSSARSGATSNAPAVSLAPSAPSRPQAADLGAEETARKVTKDMASQAAPAAATATRVAPGQPADRFLPAPVVEQQTVIPQAGRQDESKRQQTALLDTTSVDSSPPLLGTPSFGLAAAPPKDADQTGPRPGEEITVEAKDFSRVLARAGLLVNGFGGRIGAAQQSADGGSQFFYAELPTANVVAFKAQLMREFSQTPRLFGNAPGGAGGFATLGNGTSPPTLVAAGKQQRPGTAGSKAGAAAATRQPSSEVVREFAAAKVPASAIEPVAETNVSPFVVAAGVPTSASGPARMLEPEEPLPALLPSTTVLKIQVVDPER